MIYCVNPTTEKEREFYKEVYNLISNSEGLLLPKDLRIAIEKYGGFKPKRQVVYQIFSYFDRENSG